jgi:hypothetical protein
MRCRPSGRCRDPHLSASVKHRGLSLFGRLRRRRATPIATEHSTRSVRKGRSQRPKGEQSDSAGAAMNAAFCVTCGSSLPNGARFCPGCGAAVPRCAGSASGPHPVVAIERLYIDAEETKFLYEATSISNLIGWGAITQCRFVARVDSPEGSYEVAEAPFIRQYSTDLDGLVGLDREGAQKALESPHQEAVSLGFRRVDPGTRWNSRMYERAYDPQRALEPIGASLRNAAIGAAGSAPSRAATKNTLGLVSMILGIAAIPLAVLRIPRNPGRPRCRHPRHPSHTKSGPRNRRQPWPSYRRTRLRPIGSGGRINTHCHGFQDACFYAGDRQLSLIHTIKGSCPLGLARTALTG